ncbi:MAG: ABC transporter ATP-binding protein [Alphaproteobacteria bacterium]
MSGLAAQNVEAMPGSRPVLREVSVTVRPGEMAGLVGPNGAGKTTLLRVLNGLLRPRAGRVTLEGTDLDALPPRLRARKIAWLPQHQPVHWPLTAARLVALGRLPHQDPFRAPGPAEAAVLHRVMRETDTAAFAERRVNSLSAGERARVLLARALAVEAPFLLADEPVAALDPYHQLHVMELLQARAAAGTGVLVVLHDLTLAARFCNRLILLHEGRVAAAGRPGEVLNPERLESVYQVEALELTGTPAFQNAPVVLPWRRLAH